MQKVSEAYKESMKSNLRERGYISVSFGLINQQAQNKAYVHSSSARAAYSNTDIFGNVRDYDSYATLEKDYTTVDGSMIFLPKFATVYNKTGLISKSIISSDFEIEIRFKNQDDAYDLSDLTIDFGENYPVAFDVYVDSLASKEIEVTDNSSSVWVADIPIFNIRHSIIIVVHAMKTPDTRLRVYSILLGKGVVYTNEDVIDSSLETYVSPITEDIPQYDFSLTLNNVNHRFDVDYYKSEVNYFEKGQEIDVYYGYDLPDNGGTEWFQGAHLVVSEWESDRESLTLRATDALRNLETEYYKGQYDLNGVSFYTLAENLFKEAEITDYYIDPRLKNVSTKIPMPRVTVKEGLQMIANATRCILKQTRTGKISMEMDKTGAISTATCNGEMNYSNVAAIKTISYQILNEYATLCRDYTTVDGNMLFLPRTGTPTKRDNFVSNEMSNSDGTFAANPEVTIQMDVAQEYSQFSLTFSYSIVPSDFTIQTYLEDTIVQEFTITGNTEIFLMLRKSFDKFDTMKIIFTKLPKPNNRVVLKSVSGFNLDPVYSMDKSDMISSPLASKSDKIKRLNVQCRAIMNTTYQKTLIDKDISGWGDVKGHELIYYFDNPCREYTITQSGSDSTVIEEYGAYYIKIKDYGASNHHLTITGCEGEIYKSVAVYMDLNNKGNDLLWDNPLVDVITGADLLDWLRNFYNSEIEYEYDTRGNPEMDANDRIYQQSQIIENNYSEVKAYRVTTNFDQAFSGHVVTKKKGGYL